MSGTPPLSLAERYAAVKAGIPAHVTLVAVSKTRSVDEIRALYDLGHRAFGENYPQELCEKRPQLPADIEWHFIGHLQTNKVKQIAPFVHLVHGVDSTRLLDELDRRALQNNRTIQVLLQVHIAREDTKHGFTPAEAETLLKGAWAWPHLQPKGLMGMASNTTDQHLVGSEFEGLTELYTRLRGNDDRLDILSMGMSGDAPLAIAKGSTMVRIGTAIFGDRVRIRQA